MQSDNMHKITVIGAGNVGGMTALRLCQEGMGKVVLTDKFGGIAEAKAYDLKDSIALIKKHVDIIGTNDISQIEGSDIVVVTAGFARKPDMTREDLLIKNAQIIKEISTDIRDYAPSSIIIMVTNPLDTMTYVAYKTTGFPKERVIGMGVSLDTSRFVNLISEELNVSPLSIEAAVIGSHGEGMMPLARYAKVNGKPLRSYLNDEKLAELTYRTINRGAQIVELFGTGSAYVAPSAAITDIVKAIVRDEKRIIGASSYLEGEYGARDVCLGVPCIIGKAGIEQRAMIDLDSKEREAFQQSAQKIRKHMDAIRYLLD